MNSKLFIKTCLMAAALTGMTVVTAEAQAIQAQLVARPLTPQEISDYSLPASTEVSGGLTTVGVGQPVYLEIDVATNSSVPNVTNITWLLAQKPALSSAILQASPLGTNVPVYEPSDRLFYQVAGPSGRKLLRPDAGGFTTNDLYKVTATLYTANAGTTNVTITITAGSYMGVGLLPGTSGCALCHSGGQIAPNKVVPWEATGHATQFARGIDGILAGNHYGTSCLKCHTVGYDTNALAVNGGFDDVAASLGWHFPTVLTNGDWASMETNYPALANVANIQCENCHGPGSQHMDTFGKTNVIAISYGSGVCAQCHDSLFNEPNVAQWKNSVHAITTRDPAGISSCVGCHSGVGFIAQTQGTTTSDTSYHPIDCQTCHDPHGETSPTNNLHLIRAMTNVTLLDGTVVTNGGEGLLCMQCHHARQKAATYATSYHSNFGPHHGPQADMLEGVNGFNYGQTIPSSAHANAVSDSCVTCHMQTLATNNPSFLVAGGHTFNVSANGVDLVAACQQCHGPTVTSFDFSLQDYNGDGVIQGVQTEVQSLLNKLSTWLPNTNGVVDGLVKTPSPTSSWTAPQLEADYNWQFVNNDGSLGIHNTAYAVGLLKASIANLTGDANNDGLPDAWQTNYFGLLSNPNAAPNAINNTNGVPNWMMYALGLDPTQSGITVPGGVVWMNGKALVNSGVTNTIAIYTAAEIAFNTQLGNTYQIQGISNLSGGWQNIGSPVLGTGNSISYVTPTRNNAQMFFRVITNPNP